MAIAEKLEERRPPGWRRTGIRRELTSMSRLLRPKEPT